MYVQSGHNFSLILIYENMNFDNLKQIGVTGYFAKTLFGKMWSVKQLSVGPGFFEHETGSIVIKVEQSEYIFLLQQTLEKCKYCSRLILILIWIQETESFTT